MYTNKETSLAEADKYEYPVIVKPTDSSASRGVTVVKSIDGLPDAIDFALNNSRSKEFIVEEFLETEGYCSDSDCFVVNGKFKLFTFSSEGFDSRCQNPCSVWWIAWPETIEKKYIDELKSELRRLISLLHMKTAIYNIAVMVAKNGKAYIMECAPRAGGASVPETIEYLTGSDMIKNYIRYSVGIPMIEKFDESLKSKCINIELYTLIDGKFKDVWINDEISNNVIELSCHVSKGEMIYNPRSVADSIGCLRLSFSNEQQLKKVINDIDSYVRVIVD